MSSRNADQSDAESEVDAALPDPLPEEPFLTFRRWFDEAHERRVQPNPNCMTLATADENGRPSARIVLCKAMDLAPETGFVVFHTNHLGRKGRELAARPQAALVFHWDALDRQVRIEGPVTHCPVEDSDAYFQTRALESRIGAWASEQSEPIESRAALLAKGIDVMLRFGVTLDDRDARIPRPPHWGGFRVWAESVELWISGPGRVHDRAIWKRTLTPTPTGFTPSRWSAQRLQP